MEDLIRVLVVDDYFVVRKGVFALLLDADGIAVVGEARDGVEAVAQARRLAPQVILMDLKLPEMDGVQAIREILVEQPEVAIVALTSPDAEEEVLAAVEAGALGYVAKTSERQEFLAAIRCVAKREAWLPPHITRRLVAHAQPAKEAPALTERERAVLKLLARGWGNRRIAEELGITEVTVRSHMSHVLTKLGAKNRVEATLLALRSGLASLEDPLKRP